MPAIPAPVHSDDAVWAWVEHRVFHERELGVAKSSGVIVALLVLDGEWIDQLYVDPAHVGRGLRCRLLSVAKELQPEGLKLWTFTANVRARQFYERHGFASIGNATRDNEERALALRYEWNG